MEHSARRRPRACPHLAYDGAPVLNPLISRFPSVVLKKSKPPPGSQVEITAQNWSWRVSTKETVRATRLS